MSTDLRGKTAIITGAGPNIGREIAQSFASAGARVACNDIDGDAVAAAVRAVEDAGGSALAVPGDITDEAQAEAVVGRTCEAWGGVDVLVNNAAVTAPLGLLETSLDVWLHVLAVNLTGTFLMSKAVAAQMVAQGRGGAIVNVASTSGHRGRAGAAAYCASKGGVLNLTRAMANDLAPHGIRVNSVSPTKTGISVGALETAETRFHAEIPLGRLGEPVEQARAIVFLASDAASFCTGVDLRVDGGSLSTWGLPPQAVSAL